MNKIERHASQINKELEDMELERKKQEMIMAFMQALYALGLADVCDVGEDYAMVWRQYHELVGSFHTSYGDVLGDM